MSKIKIESCSILVRDVETGEGIFAFTFYGVSASQLSSVPIFDERMSVEEYQDFAEDYGGAIVRRALRRRGLNPSRYIASPFDIIKEKGVVLSGHKKRIRS